MFLCRFFMEVNKMEVEVDFPNMATLFWAEGLRWRRWKNDQQKAGCRRCGRSSNNVEMPGKCETQGGWERTSITN